MLLSTQNIYKVDIRDEGEKFFSTIEMADKYLNLLGYACTQQYNDDTNNAGLYTRTGHPLFADSDARITSIGMVTAINQ